MDDLLEGMMKMMEQNDCVGPVNIGNPNEFTIRQLAQTVLKKIDSQSSLVEMPLPSDDPTQRKPDISQAKKLLDLRFLTNLA